MNSHVKKSGSGLIRDLMISFLAFCLLVLISYAFRDAFNTKPICFLSILGTAIVAFCVAVTSTPWLRKIQMLSGALLFALCLVELGMMAAGRFHVGSAKVIRSYDPSFTDFIVQDKDLGYRAIAGSGVRSIAKVGNESIYDVVYHIDQHGQRVTMGDTEAESVWFFGGSFTFGDGVQDHEALPACVSQLTGNRYDVVNFGFSGWGPHQMLRILETKREKPRFHGDVKHVVYVAISDHVRRCAGRTPWDFGGPNYQMNSDGEIEYQGPFYSGVFKYVPIVLNRSWSGASLVHSWKNLVHKQSQRDVDTYAEIVAKAGSVIKERYDTVFHVVFWRLEPDQKSDAIIDALAQRGINVIDLASFSDSDQLAGMVLHQHDRHPTAEAYQIVARFLTEQLNLNVEPLGKVVGLN